MTFAHRARCFSAARFLFGAILTGNCQYGNILSMAKINPKGAAFTQLVIEIFRLNHLLLEAGDELTAPVKLSSARWQVLGVVEHGAMPVANVARLMGLKRQSVQQTADGLERDGFIEYAENLHHRRAKLVKITPKGVRALATIRPNVAAWANHIGAPYSLSEWQKVVAMMRELREALQQNAPADE